MPAKDSTFIVPETAFINSDLGIYVIKSVTGKTRRIPVEKGRTISNMVEVYGNLAPGDTLVTKTTEEIKDKMVLSGRKLSEVYMK